MSCYREAAKGKRQPLGVAYLNQMDHMVKKCSATTPQDVCTLQVIADGFNFVCANVVKKAAIDFESQLKKGLSEDHAASVAS